MDNNLVVYGRKDVAYWGSDTHSCKACTVGGKLEIQNDGNAVLYSADGGAVWSTQTSGPQKFHDSRGQKQTCCLDGEGDKLPVLPGGF